MSSSSPTRTTYSNPYAALSPLRPEVSQAGRTVLITGGNSGIGYAAARAFCQAGASRVIITGRRAEATREAAATLESQLANPNTKFVGVTCDMAKADAVERLWAALAAEGKFVDVLVLNATGIAGPGRILERGTEKIWTDYDINVRAQLRTTEYFYKQKSTSATGDKRREMADGGHDVANLPGQFAVWAASTEAKFLHGRFVYSAWDVNELKGAELRKKISEDEDFLRIGVVGF
ncbi:short chain dehydrogenase [Seiridium cupressi]